MRRTLPVMPEPPPFLLGTVVIAEDDEDQRAIDSDLTPVVVRGTPRGAS